MAMFNVTFLALFASLVNASTTTAPPAVRLPNDTTRLVIDHHTADQFGRTLSLLRAKIDRFVRRLKLTEAAFGCQGENVFGKLPFRMDFHHDLAKKLNLTESVTSDNFDFETVETQLRHLARFSGYRNLLKNTSPSQNTTNFAEALRKIVDSHNNKQFARGLALLPSHLHTIVKLLDVLIDRILSLLYTAVDSVGETESQPTQFAFPASFDNSSYQEVETTVFVMMRAMCADSSRYKVEFNRFAKNSDSRIEE